MSHNVFPILFFIRSQFTFSRTKLQHIAKSSKLSSLIAGKCHGTPFIFQGSFLINTHLYRSRLFIFSRASFFSANLTSHSVSTKSNPLYRAPPLFPLNPARFYSSIFYLYFQNGHQYNRHIHRGKNPPLFLFIKICIIILLSSAIFSTELAKQYTLQLL